MDSILVLSGDNARLGWINPGDILIEQLGKILLRSAAPRRGRPLRTVRFGVINATPVNCRRGSYAPESRRRRRSHPSRKGANFNQIAVHFWRDTHVITPRANGRCRRLLP